MLTIKIVNQSGDIRRVQIPNEGKMFQALNESIVMSFGLPATHFTYSYIDDEGDRCGIAGEEEMREAVRLHQEGNKKKVLKIWLHDQLVSDAQVVAEAESKVAIVENVTEEAPSVAPSVLFVEDATFPDGTEARGTVRKVWRVKNNGSVAWPKGCTLRGTDDTKVELPCVLPGKECLLSVDINLPDEAGPFKQMFSLVSDPPFTGDTNLWCQLNIPAARPSATFVKDIKLEDGTVIAPDQVVTKTWAFKNDGKDPWPQDCKLVFVKGQLTPVTTEVAIPVTPAGEVATINVDLRTPSCYGHHKALFQLTGADGLKFENDHQAWCHLLIKPVVSKKDFLAVQPYMMKDPEVLAATEKLLGLKPAHPGIFCNLCGLSPIRGSRFKCTICPDFDMCVDCEAKGDHPSSHVLLKLKQALSSDTVNGIVDEKQKIWLKGRIDAAKYQSKSAAKLAKKMSKHAAKQAKHAAKHAKLAANLVIKQAKHAEKVMTKNAEKAAKQVKKEARKAEKFMAKQAKQASRQARKEARKAEKVVAKQAKQAAKQAKQAAKAMKKAATQAFNAMGGQETKQVYKVVFLQDVTIPDGSTVQSGSVIRKTWRLKNAGSTAWPEGTELICVRGDATMTSSDAVTVSCLPGDTVDVSVELKVGSKLGRNKTFFRLKIPSGRRIGAKLWLDVFVVIPVSDNAQPQAEAVTQAAPPCQAPESAAAQEQEQEQEQEQKLSDAEESAIAVLTSMGFTDKTMLISLLEAAGGNLETVLGWLMAQPRAN